MGFGLFRHVGVLQTANIMNLCNYAYHPNGAEYERDEAPYHCRCLAPETDQWGREQTVTNNLYSQFDRTTGYSGLAYAMSAGPFRQGAQKTQDWPLMSCSKEAKLPEGALCWKNLWL